MARLSGSQVRGLGLSCSRSLETLVSYISIDHDLIILMMTYTLDDFVRISTDEKRVGMG